ncbi:MAG TPA: glycosyltransferase [Syntrophomonadaceae bacterium]|nr:glycosyltransferase [Syntrophomonadaceae bacterium]HPR92823.1 glycosyltransferase [Syntrophomonadaceae bacterium]
MIRTGFFLNLNYGWVGGINYYRNLLTAIFENENNIIEPVIFFPGNKNVSNLLEGFPPFEIVRDRCFDRYSLSWFLQRVGEKDLKNNIVLEKQIKTLLYENNIEVISHSVDLFNLNLSSPMLGWIPDFQHLRMPEFFSGEELEQRKQRFTSLCDESARIILSSFSARKDLALFAPEHVDKSRVLQFPVKPVSQNDILGLAELQKKYNFSGSYFHLPNQFWKHKNHRIVIEALKILKSKNHQVRIIATGNTVDYRHPGFFDNLLYDITRDGLLDSFIILGLVPYTDMVSLMFNSVAVINPSFFEGWSTTVEEARSIGKKLILSDIDVHREQAPRGAHYFDPQNAEELAAVLWEVWSSFDNEHDRLMRIKAQEDFPIRWKNFAESYSGIVLESLEVKRHQPK